MSIGRKRSFNYQPLIRLKQLNPYVPAQDAIDILGLQITKTAVRKIWRNAKETGEVNY
jgi:hypothetical protein